MNAKEVRDAELEVIRAARLQPNPTQELLNALGEYDRTHVFTEAKVERKSVVSPAVTYGDV